MPCDPTTISLHTTSPLDSSPLWTEYLLTNALGGFSLGTPAAINLRRYHALLVAARTPPVDRVAVLSAVADTLTFITPAGEFTLTLTPFHFSGAPDRPIAPPVPCLFSRTPRACTWTYTIPLPGLATPATCTRTLRLTTGRNAASLTWSLASPLPARIALRPLTPLRDFHHLATPDDLAATATSRPIPRGFRCQRQDLAITITADGPATTPHHAPEIWRDIAYLRDHLRGDNATEALYSPGLFHAGLPAPGTIQLTLHAALDEPARPPTPAPPPPDPRITTRLSAQVPEPDRPHASRLLAAADDFVVQRAHAPTDPTNPPSPAATIIAGYPWFTDWGRDTMIALPGLLLATGRHTQALAALTVFADHRRNGLIPNRFDDRTTNPDSPDAQSPAHYNTADASLWFLAAAAEYRRATRDHTAYADRLAPACLDIIDAHRRGTDFAIAMDADGLITAGDPHTQLTWMDAQRDGVTFTPRHGKAVEINALWIHGLRATAHAIRADQPDTAAELLALADRAADSFRRAFVRPDGLGLFDRLEPRPDGSWLPIPEIRPNQILAVSLPTSPLSHAEQAAALHTVESRLLTPFGLRTLDPDHPAYQPRYEGDMMQRDRAYHNGTVWPWLIGPYAEAVLRVGCFSQAARDKARAALQPLLEHLAGPGLGQLPEVFDADPPHRPDGCPAQAWSIAEPLRILLMLHEPADPYSPP